MASSVKVVVLAENTAGGRGMLGEHGLALWIEAEGRKLLFDTGQGLVLASNAAKLGLDLSGLEAVLLSHGHYDHTGGLAAVLDAAPRAKVLAHPGVLEPKYARNRDGSSRPVGPGSMTPELLRRSGRFEPVCGPIEVAEGICLTGPIGRRTDFEDTGGAFFLDEACTRPDPLLDDQGVYIQGLEGTSVLLGCAHAGLINTLLHVRRLTDGRAIHTIAGGMHLLHANANRMQRTLEALSWLDPVRILPCHCTGTGAVWTLWERFGRRVGSCPVGTVLEIPR
jgi:7,8-dihydropterin-6-yl-methyl-4-(beta-D-ribofuranosyl)aminobenzene 5'-phosphate synthase